MRVPKSSQKHQAGFTLIEVLLATVLFGIAILAIVSGQRTSQRSVRESENLFRAIQLAQLKMTEMEFKFQKVIDRDGVKEGSFTTENGTFDKPYDSFKWTAVLRESTLKFERDQILKLLLTLGLDKETAEAQMEDQRLLLTNLNKTLKENYAEVFFTVQWEAFGRKQSLPIVTHLIPTKPKITLTQTAED